MSKEEQEFHILPHPAKDNFDPNNGPEKTPGFGSAPTLGHLPKGPNATQAKGPYVPSEEIAKGLEKPKTREELQALGAKLNE